MTKKAEIAKNILYGVSLVGLVVASLALPGLPVALSSVLNLGGKYKYSKRQVRRSLYYLRDNKLISITYELNKTVIRLTKNGKEKLLKYNLEDIKLPKKSKWDSKWRIVIFDIPESLKISRKMFVKKIKELGFINLQKSVWVWPHECEDEIDFLKEMYKIRPFVRIVTADKVDIQSDLIRKFGLK